MDVENNKMESLYRETEQKERAFNYAKRLKIIQLSINLMIAIAFLIIDSLFAKFSFLFAVTLLILIIFNYSFSRWVGGHNILPSLKNK